MPAWYLSGFYKGLFILLVVFVGLIYLIGSVTDVNTPLVNSTRLQNLQPNHGPLFNTLIFRNKFNRSFTDNTTRTILYTNLDYTVTEPSFSNALNYSTSVGALFDTNTPLNSENVSADSKFMSSTVVPLCPDISTNLRKFKKSSPHIGGRVQVVKTPVPTVQELEQRFSWLLPGGHWQPDTCGVTKKVAIVIPFRCRGEHLLVFLQHMHPFLRRQQLDYTVYIIEQEGSGPFNRAMLMNIGFKEALKIKDYDCFIFHDIDLLPQDDRNLYTCPEQPRHMSVAVDIFGYRLPYPAIFGGVSAITKQHFQLLNGFSNSFWGWGGEDDDMSNRIRYHHLFISRYPINIARYTMLTHKKDKPSPNRYDMLKQGQKRFDKDGLNSLKYKVVQSKKNLLYTWILANIDSPR